MKFQTKELKKVVSNLSLLLDDNTTTDLAAYIYFKGDKIITTDGSNVLYFNFAKDFDFDFLVPAKEFTAFLNKVKKEEIEVIQNDNLIFKAGRIKLELNNIASQESLLSRIEVSPEFADLNFSALPEDFDYGIRFVSDTVSKDLSNIISQIYIDNDCAVSTDRYRLSKYNFEKPIDNLLLLDQKAVNFISKFGDIFYSISDNKLLLNSGDYTYITFSSDNQFLPYEKVIENLDNAEGTELQFTQEIINDIEITDIFKYDTEMDKKVTLNFKDGKLVLSAESTKGRIEVDVDFECDKEFSIDVNTNFLISVLKKCTDVTVFETSMLFKADNFLQIVGLKV